MTDQELFKKLCKVVLHYHNSGEDGRFPCRCKLCVAAKEVLKRVTGDKATEEGE
jgi:hypothetical protein